jgi:hypothetical protein
MSQFDITGALAAEQTHDRARAAHQSALAAVARCCRPSNWGRALRRVTEATTVLLRPRPSARVACCA